MSTRAEDVYSSADTATESSPIRFVTAASLFDGHDAAINVMRRLIQDQGVEVIHLGHNRSVADVVRAAVQEDADGIAISSYQGGHNEYFRYMVDMLNEAGAGHVRVFGGGGGTITPEEIAELHDYGVERIYHPHDGMKLGLLGMIEDLVTRTVSARRETTVPEAISTEDALSVAQMLSAIEDGIIPPARLDTLRKEWRMTAGIVPVIGITGTGGAGKSSVTDEILSRFCQYLPDLRIAVLAVDPTRRRTGGALLGDRIRMNSLSNNDLYMRSLASRGSGSEISANLDRAIEVAKAVGFDLIFCETSGIGQGSDAITTVADHSL
ncbi:MAG: cobalamin-dependent protein, partial [Gammaproteobacteria bacterium]